MTDLDVVLSALNHPIRRSILRAIVDDPRSASSLSREFGRDLGTVSYHLNHVLAQEHEMVELVDAVQKRGALEKFFKLKADALKHRPGEPQQGEQGQMSMEECVLAIVLGVLPPPDVGLPGS